MCKINIAVIHAIVVYLATRWKTDDVRPEIDENAKYVGTILILKPYTQYALYVQTYTIATAKTGAMSAITYLKTKTDSKSCFMFLLYHYLLVLSLLHGQILLSYIQLSYIQFHNTSG